MSWKYKNLTANTKLSPKSTEKVKLTKRELKGNKLLKMNKFLQKLSVCYVQYLRTNVLKLNYINVLKEYFMGQH